MPDRISVQHGHVGMDEVFNVYALHELRLQHDLQTHPQSGKQVLGVLQHENVNDQILFDRVQVLKYESVLIETEMLHGLGCVDGMFASLFRFGSQNGVGDYPRMHPDSVSIQNLPADMLGDDGIVLGFGQHVRE